MYRRAGKSSKEEKAAPVGIRFKSLDTDSTIRTATLDTAGTGRAEEQVVPKEENHQSEVQPEAQPEATPPAQVSPVPEVPVPASVEVPDDDMDVDDVVEAIVCGVDDLNNGEMREVDIGDGKALLVKEDGEFHAIGAKCTHYGAPLIKGVFCNGHVRCPWHGACFNVKTGDIEDFPGLDSVPKFEVETSDGQVKIRAKAKALENHKRMKTMACRAPGLQGPGTVIVGGGPAALACAETLRQEQYGGRIVLISRDRHLPYDRPKLSKMMNVKAEDAILRGTQFFKESDIEIQLEKEVTAIDTTEKKVILDNGDAIDYENLLLATGTVARNLLSTPGHDLRNIRTLRTLDDASLIAGQAKDKNVVIIGTSFIGVETAAYLADKAKSVTIVDLVEAPFQLALGKEVGQGVKKLLEENGIKFYFKNSAKEFKGENGKLKQVVLQDDTELDADICIVGIGVVPATDLLKDSSIELTDRGFVSVDKHMATSQPNVFAAGDITHFPLFMVDDEKVNIQHWQMAHQQGRIAALNILNKSTDIKSVPFFWTMLFGKSIRYTGYGFGYDDVIIHGNPEELKFVAYYTKGDTIVAVASMGEDPIAAHAAEAFLSTDFTLTADMVRENNSEWTAKL